MQNYLSFGKDFFHEGVPALYSLTTQLLVVGSREKPQEWKIVQKSISGRTHSLPQTQCQIFKQLWYFRIWALGFTCDLIFQS